MLIRTATPEDADACAAIYAPYVTETAISFETEPPTSAEMADRIANAIAWFVFEVEKRKTATPWYIDDLYFDPYRRR